MKVAAQQKVSRGREAAAWWSLEGLQNSLLEGKDIKRKERWEKEGLGRRTCRERRGQRRERQE